MKKLAIIFVFIAAALVFVAMPVIQSDPDELATDVHAMAGRAVADNYGQSDNPWSLNASDDIESDAPEFASQDTSANQWETQIEDLPARAQNPSRSEVPPAEFRPPVSIADLPPERRAPAGPPTSEFPPMGPMPSGAFGPGQAPDGSLAQEF